MANSMELVLLADIGSTYTKLLVVDIGSLCVVSKAFGLTTAKQDITIGLRAALDDMEKQTGFTLKDFRHRLACCSAAGGLQMAAIGLVPELTAEAAKRASLGAGARVLKTYSYEMTESDKEDLESQPCDIILLAGGTDGGDRSAIRHNARCLASTSLQVPVIVAGNRIAADEVKEILQTTGKEVIVTENVLPSLKKLNIEPARKAIREVFIDKIIEGKGFEQIQDMLGSILMPTPAAVMEAARLLSGGLEKKDGLGDLVVVDIGGATTDVHSVAEGVPTTPNTVERGLPEPLVKRTVEGDLGLRVSVLSLLEAAGVEHIQKEIDGSEEGLRKKIELLSKQIDYLPASDEDLKLEAALAKAAAEIAMNRHAGFLEKLTTPSGIMYSQTGKDLTRVRYVIGTGGIFAHSPYAEAILKKVCMDPKRPDRLKPTDPKLIIDKQYLLWGMGLLQSYDPKAALKMMKKRIIENEK